MKERSYSAREVTQMERDAYLVPMPDDDAARGLAVGMVFAATVIAMAIAAVVLLIVYA